MDTRTGEVAPEAEFEERVKTGRMTRAEFNSYVRPIDPLKLSPKNLHQLAVSGRTWISRNSACPCGSGKRFKRCCMARGR
jgi:uncharacterized protein YecA (UPF0149 family)